jgi:L-asparagine transporter-like permease
MDLIAIIVGVLLAFVLLKVLFFLLGLNELINFAKKELIGNPFLTIILVLSLILILCFYLFEPTTLIEKIAVVAWLAIFIKVLLYLYARSNNNHHFN